MMLDIYGYSKRSKYRGKGQKYFPWWDSPTEIRVWNNSAYDGPPLFRVSKSTDSEEWTIHISGAFSASSLGGIYGFVKRLSHIASPGITLGDVYYAEQVVNQSSRSYETGDGAKGTTTIPQEAVLDIREQHPEVDPLPQGVGLKSEDRGIES